MNKVVRTVSKIQPFQFRQCFFHSSPILERKRRSENSFSSYYRMRSRKMRGKAQENANSFAEDIFQSWQGDFQEFHPSFKETQSSRRKPAWFTEDFFSDSSSSRRRRPGGRGPNSGSQRRFEFFEDYDDSEVEHTFHTSFGDEDRDFFYTFTSKDFETEDPSSPNYRSQSERKWRHEFDYENRYSEEYNGSTPELSSYRHTLGLKASGPLSLEDVKTAYRSCAFKWHPDRHQGSSKAAAEEKFKACSTAYQSLCDKLALN